MEYFRNYPDTTTPLEANYLNQVLNGFNDDIENLKLSNVYSEEEIIIGYVIENSKKVPIYRKVFEGNTGTETIEFSLNNVEYMVDMRGTIIVNDFIVNLGTYWTDNYKSLFQYQNNKVYLSYGTEFNNKPYKVTLEYTKTTD